MIIIEVKLIFLNIVSQSPPTKSVKSILFKSGQFENISLTEALVILKFDKLRNCNFIQSINILFILLTFDVS